MCDQTEVQYLPGEVVWVKLRALWWPGLVQDYDSLPEEITSSLRKRPIATVKFFQEDSYEYVHKLDLIYHYNCSRKHEFIKKGIDLCRKKTADRPATMDFFPMDIVTAEELTHGDPNILQDEAFKPEEKPKYTSLFGSEKKKFGKKKGKEDSPLKDKVARRKKLTSKLQAMGWLSRGITANIIYPSPDIPRMVTHRRFLNKGRNPDAKSDYEVRIREQKCEDELRLEKTYECVLCGYETGRLNVIVLHFNNNHSQKTKNFFPTPSILKGGSFRNPLLKLKSEHRKSDSGKSSLLPKKRASLKAKVEKVKVEESDGDSSENEIVKPVPIKKEKGKPGRKRKIKPEEKDRPEEVKEVIKKPKVLDSLLADWDEDVEQEDDEVDSEKRQDDEDDNVSDVNASVDDDTGSAKDESSLVEDASSASKSKEVFEFDPDEDDNIDFDLTPNVKGFGRRIPRVIDSSKEKKQGVSAKKPSKGKGSKKVEDEEDDEFATLLAETSMPSLPSVPKASTFSMDTEDDLNPTFDKSQDETSSKSVLKEENKTEVVKEDEKEQKSKNSDPEVDLAVDSKNPPQGHEDKITAKVTVETVPDLAITSPEHNEDRLLSGDELPKSESKPGQSTSGGDHTYVSGGSARKRRRSLLPLEKGDSMAVPVVLDDEFPIEESPRVHKKPVLPSEPGQQPRRRGRPPKRGGGARSGGRGMKSAPPTKSPKSPPYQSPKSPPYQSPKSPSPHLSPAPLRGSKSPSPHAMSPPRYTGPKSPPLSQGSKSPQPQRSPKSPAEQTPKSPERTPKSPSNRQSSKSPSVQPSPKILPPMSPKSPMRSPVRSPEAYQGPKSPVPQSPKSPRSPQPYQSPSHQGPKSPQPLLSPKSPPALLSPKSPKPLEVKTIKSPLQSSMKKSTALSNPPALASIKSVVKSPQPSPSSQAIVVSSSTPMKSTAGKILTPVGKGGAVLKKVVTSNAVIVQSKPDLQPEACGLGKMIASPPSSAATSSSSAPAVKTIKLAVSGAPGSSPVVVSKAGTPGTPGTRKVMIVKGKGGTQQMVLPAEASQQLLSNIGTGKKIMVITKGAGGQQQKIMLTPQQQKLLTSGTSSAQIVTSKGTVLSSVAKLVSTKPSTSRASTGNIAGGLELSTEPPALVKTDSKKTYKIITSPQSKGNILLNTSGGQILLPVSSIAASGSGVTTASGSKQFILPVGAKNMKLLNAVSGSGQKVILQMKSSPAKVGAMATTKTIQPIVPKTMQSIASKTVQAISPKGLQTITQKTVQAISPKNVQPITPKGSTPVKVTKIATMVQPVPQLTPIGSPKTPRPQKQIKTVVAKQVKSAPPAKAPRKSNVLPKASIAASSSTTVVLPSTPNRNSGILPNPNLKPLVPQLKTSKKISLAAKPASVDSTPVSSMPGTVQVVTGSVPGLEPIQTTLVPSAETSSTVPLPTSTQQFITVPTDDGGQMMYLIDNSSLMNLEGSNPSNLQNIILTFDNMGQPVSSAGSDFTFAAPSSGQDILAEALANTLQPEAPGGDLSLDTSGLLSSHTSSTIYQPTLSHGVLETSLTLNQPIMTPLEDLSAVSTLQPPPATGAATSVDIPSTITVPDITISTSSYSSLPIPSATIQSTVFSDVQHVTTFSTAAPADGNVFIEAPSTEGESFLSTDGVYEQSSEGASMPLLDG